MTKAAMSKMALIVGLLCIVLAIVVLVYAEGLRRWYSGIFFAFTGALMLVNAQRWRSAAEG